MRTDEQNQKQRSKQMMNLEEFLDAYSLSRYMFYKQVNDGSLEITKIGTLTFVTQKQADAWMDVISAQQIAKKK